MLFLCQNFGVCLYRVWGFCKVEDGVVLNYRFWERVQLFFIGIWFFEQFQGLGSCQTFLVWDLGCGEEFVLIFENFRFIIYKIGYEVLGRRWRGVKEQRRSWDWRKFWFWSIEFRVQSLESYSYFFFYNRRRLSFLDQGFCCGGFGIGFRVAGVFIFRFFFF